MRLPLRSLRLGLLGLLVVVAAAPLRAEPQGSLSAIARAAQRLEKLGAAPRVALRAGRHVALGLPSPADRVKEDDYLLVRNGYVLSYNARRNAMNWASWAVEATDLGAVDRDDPFRPDPTLPAHFYKPNNGDYKLPGYSRGHMVRSGERTATQRENDKTFVFTNMLPQAVNNNSGPWNAFENYYRDEVQKGMTAHVIAGGVFGTPPVQPRGVAIPSATWKVVALLKPGQTPDQIDEHTRVISIVVPNNNDDVKVEHGWDRYRTSIADIEQQTGLSLLGEVPAAVRATLRARVDAEAIPAAPPRAFQLRNHGENAQHGVAKVLQSGMRGTVKWYSSDKKFGFLRAADGTEVFVHASGRLTSIAAGEDVTFDVAQGADGRAFAVRVKSLSPNATPEEDPQPPPLVPPLVPPPATAPVTAGAAF